MISRLSRRDDFHALRRDGRSVRRGPLRVGFRAAGSADAGVRVAYAIPRPVGSAVVRNRLRRRLRAILVDIDRSAPALPAGDYLVRVRPGASDSSFDELGQYLADAIDELSRN
ncbi:MAG TPA: ribonuclease P protein component [Acidimicrobiaceae bacterium]|nr:ribonuclease P protein component [Acidimicrobiales bacterium]HAZ17884.1 ribonuclease P protein component [Acidimicrobiaceae bacterium]HBA94896.1 ribonuclease P protein component [Acidimicrobiaceae bacterium]HIE67317.1 ribonuclease P protein component [Acidimicrobiia bacterium]